MPLPETVAVLKNAFVANKFVLDASVANKFVVVTLTLVTDPKEAFQRREGEPSEKERSEVGMRLEETVPETVRVPVTVAFDAVKPPNSESVLVANDPRAETVARVSDSVEVDAAQLVPSARQTWRPFTNRLVVDAVPETKRLEVVADPETIRSPEVVAFPCRLMEKTVFPRSFTPRIRKSLAFEVPLERTSRVVRVPEAAVLEVWLRVKSDPVPNTVLEAYMPFSCLALKACGAEARRFLGVISLSALMVTPRNRLSWFQSTVSKVFCPVSPRRMVKRPFWTETETAVGVTKVPAAVHTRLPPVSASYRENWME